MNIDNAYIQSFNTTANENGADPEYLLKFASGEALTKSTPLNEVLLGAIPTAVVPGAASIGSLSGFISAPDSDQKDYWANIIPGVASHRLANRLKTQVMDEYKDHKVDGHGQLVAESLGQILPSLLYGGLGAAVGSRIGGLKGERSSFLRRFSGDMSNKQKGALIGAGIGALTPQAANIVGAIIAGIKRRRTDKEQLDHDRDRSNIAKDLLVPGVGSYNRLKRLGRSQADRDEKEEKNKSKNTKKAASYIKSAAPLSELLSVAKRTGTINTRLARALTSVGRGKRRFSRLPESAFDEGKYIADDSIIRKGVDRATAI